MNKIILAAAMLLYLAPGLPGCTGKSSSEAPLQQDMTFTYSKSMEYDGDVKNEEITLSFEKAGDDLFIYNRTVAEPDYVYEADPVKVTGYLKYNKVMDVLVGGYNLWWDPATLASGKMGKLEITEGTYNGKDVYVVEWGPNQTAYYAKDTGFCEGSVTRSDMATETLVRID